MKRHYCFVLYQYLYRCSKKYFSTIQRFFFAGIEFSEHTMSPSVQISFSMSNNVPIQRLEDITIRPLAPIVPMKSIQRGSHNEKKPVLKPKLKSYLPIIYDKPIYKSKKYDLL